MFEGVVNVLRQFIICNAIRLVAYANSPSVVELIGTFSVLLSFDYLFPNAGFLQDFFQHSFILQDFFNNPAFYKVNKAGCIIYVKRCVNLVILTSKVVGS